VGRTLLSAAVDFDLRRDFDLGLYNLPQGRRIGVSAPHGHEGSYNGCFGV
jgi:hypothetical protein